MVQPTLINLETMEALIADPDNSMDSVAELLGVSESLISQRKNSDKGFKRAYDRGQLRREAACIDKNGSSPDDLIMEAIELGFDTRQTIKQALGFDYHVIEPCLERHAGEYKIEWIAQIEHFYPLAHMSVDSVVSVPIPVEENNKPTEVRPMKQPMIPRSEVDKVIARNPNPRPEREVVVDVGDKNDTKRICGCGRDYAHFGQCKWRRKYGTSDPKATTPQYVEIDIPRAGELRAQGLDHTQIARELGVNFHTYTDHRASDKALKESLRKGREKWLEKEQKLLEDVNPNEANDQALIVRDTPDQTEQVQVTEGDGVNRCVYSSLPRALMLQGKWNSEYWLTCYNILIAMLDDEITEEEKAAVWLLIRYNKSLQAAIMDCQIELGISGEDA